MFCIRAGCLLVLAVRCLTKPRLQAVTSLSSWAAVATALLGPGAGLSFCGVVTSLPGSDDQVGAVTCVLWVGAVTCVLWVCAVTVCCDCATSLPGSVRRPGGEISLQNMPLLKRGTHRAIVLLFWGCFVCVCFGAGLAPRWRAPVPSRPGGDSANGAAAARRDGMATSTLSLQFWAIYCAGIPCLVLHTCLVLPMHVWYSPDTRYHPAWAVWHALLHAHAHGMLIGACNPML